MMLVSFVAACFVLRPTVSGADSGWVLWGQSLYRANPDQIGKLNYTSAVRFCERRCAHLAVPSSKAKNDFIWDLYKESSPTTGMWIGCLRNDSDEWRCAEDGGAGIDTQFRNWSPSHESHSLWPNRLCSVIAVPGAADEGGQWRAWECYRSKWVLCEKPLQQPAALPRLCTTTACDVQSCLLANLLNIIQYSHLSKVVMHAAGSQYSVTTDSDFCSQTTSYSVSSRDVTMSGMKAVSWNIAVQYANKEKDGVTEPL